MGEFGKLRKALIDKINENDNDQVKIELIIDCFMDAIVALDWSVDDQVEFLLAVGYWYKSGYVTERTHYLATAIKVNYGF